MNPATWIAIYLPVFYMFFIIIPLMGRRTVMLNRLKRKKGDVKMSNELIKSCIGKVCNISSGSYGKSYQQVKILEVVDNWMKVEKKGKIDLINVDFIQNIKIVSDK